MPRVPHLLAPPATSRRVSALPAAVPAQTMDGVKRPLFVLSTEGKTREQMKAEARAALAAALATQHDDDTDDDS
jgi:hypothetical protein